MEYMNGLREVLEVWFEMALLSHAGECEGLHTPSRGSARTSPPRNVSYSLIRSLTAVRTAYSGEYFTFR
jgi:hypothetical protein